jgi:hypothetical protein
MNQVSTYYPRVSRFGAAVEKKVEKVCTEQKEKRPDLYALAFSYVVFFPTQYSQNFYRELSVVLMWQCWWCVQVLRSVEDKEEDLG